MRGKRCNMWVLFLSVFFLMISCDRSNPADHEYYERDLQLRLDSVAAAFLAQGETVGFSIAVLSESDTLYNKGFGFVDSLYVREVSTSTVFNLASISKFVASIMTLKLVEDGILSLDQTLGELLPEYPNQEQAAKIELQHLISMTSGLKEYAPHFDSIYINEGKSPNKQDIYNYLSENELGFEPGTFYRYCNSGFWLLPYIMEHATGMHFESLVDSIMNSRGQLDLKLMDGRQSDSRLTQFFEIGDNIIEHRPPWTWIRGDGGLTTSAINLAHIPILLQTEQFFSDSLFKLMIAPRDLGNQLTSGYGLGVKSGHFLGAPMWGHSGADKSFWSMMYFFPEEEVSIVTLVNTNNTFYDAKELFIQVAQEVLERFIPEYEGEEHKNDDLSAYVGTYFRPGDHNRDVLIDLNGEDHHLYYHYGQGYTRMEKMYYGGNDDFYVERWPADRIHFVRGKGGKVLALEEYYAGYFSQLRKKRSQ